MTSAERYYSAHLRSLFISKFRYKTFKSVDLVRAMRWVFIIKPTFYPLAALLCLVVTGRWPLHRRIRRYVRGSRAASAVLQLTVRFGNTFSRYGLRLLQKCRFLHFPYIDSALLSADSLFDAFYVDSGAVSLNWRLVLPTFQELEALIGGSLAATQTVAKSMHLKCFFSSSAQTSLYSLVTATRALQLPLAESSSLEKSCRNALCLWVGGRAYP